MEVASHAMATFMNWKRSTLIVLGLICWLTAVAIGVSILTTYSFTPGVAGNPPERWPATSRISPPPSLFTLVMAVHPRCSCSRASIGELSELMAHSGGRLAAFVVFEQPSGFDDQWTKSDLWSSAGEIPGVTRVIDRGTEANLFGASTSGQTMVYDGRGRLVFSGGITEARGHFGDNAGVSAIAELLDRPTSAQHAKSAAYRNKPAVDRDRTAVYGCPLFAPASIRKSERGKCAK